MDALIGESAVMQALRARLIRFAQSDAPVLIEGETGTGKDLAARAIHQGGPRAGGPFVVVDCGALPETLLEAELFGHARGAFTGAVAGRAGAIESAEGGTVFLDEIGELPPAMQPSLLRALETRTVRRLGETTYRPVDVRFISATHRNLEAMVRTQAFRQDLYFRLAVLPATVPPLRARPDDIANLVAHFLSAHHAAPLDPATVRRIAARPWPGNVRELRSFVERVMALGAHEALALAEDAATGVAEIAPAAEPTPLPAAAPILLDEETLTLPFSEVRAHALMQFEHLYVEALLTRHGHNVSAAAKASRLNRTYLYRLIRRHGLADSLPSRPPSRNPTT